VYAKTAAHTAGTVDVVVTNPDGRSATLSDAYTYVPASAFDLNGRWSGYGNAGQDIPIDFTIENDLLIGVSCDVSAILTFSPGIPVVDGEFALLRRDDGVVFSGRVVGKGAAVGKMHLGVCTATEWTASK
jgi:hypothetical protein